MSAPADPAFARAGRVFTALAARLAPLGLPLAHVSPAGLIEQATSNEFTPAQPHFLPGAPKGVNAPTLIPLPGENAWLVQSGMRLSRRVGWYATIIRTSSVATAPPAEVTQLAALLHASVQDLTQLDADTHTLAQFSDRLAQSYEEVKLIFRMSRQMNGSSNPARVMTRLCDDVRELLPFGFVGIQFASEGVHAALRDRLFVSGIPGSGKAEMTEACRSMLDRVRTHRSTQILRVGSDALAEKVGSEFIGKPIDHDGQFIAALVAGDKSGDAIEREVSSFELQFLDAAAEFIGIYHENACRFAEQQEMFRGTLGAMIASLDAKDPYTAGHSDRVGLLARQLALAIGLDEETARRYEIAGLVHDIGKIGVPEAVLCKPGRLTDEEFALIKLHPEIGHRILKDIPSMRDVLPGVLHHHEHWSGRGYPHRIAGESIPLQARVLALADTFDAMSSNRSYRSAMDRTRVLAEITRCAGTQFDPALVPAFVSLDFSEFDARLQVRTSAAEPEQPTQRIAA